MAYQLQPPSFGQVKGARGKSEAKWGVKMQTTASNHVCEAELDMHRRNAQMHWETVRRWLGVILGFQTEAPVIGTPRRSIDREQQEYTPYYD